MIQKFFSPSVLQWHTNMRDVITWVNEKREPKSAKKQPVPEPAAHAFVNLINLMSEN